MAREIWRYAGTSVTGTRHRARGEACQDRHIIRNTPEGALIAIASDGAGSARFGGEGAELLCSNVAASLERHLKQTDEPSCSRSNMMALGRSIRDGVRSARSAVRAVAHGRDGSTLADFHATLVGGVLLPGRGGLLFHIGDGAAIAMSANGDRWTLSAPRNGEYADTTYFFTDDEWWLSLRLAKALPDQRTLFVMTDGVTDIGLANTQAGKVPYMPFFLPISRFLADRGRTEGETALAATLDSPGICERTTDDKTLIWASCG